MYRVWMLVPQPDRQHEQERFLEADAVRASRAHGIAVSKDVCGRPIGCRQSTSCSLDLSDGL